MATIKSYKDFKSPFNKGRFPLADAPVNPLMTASRRSHMQQYLVWILPGWHERLDPEWKKAETAVCEDIASAGHKFVRESWFEYQIDRMAYINFFHMFKICVECEVPVWPWEDLSYKDITSASDKKNSSVYDAYLKMHATASSVVEKDDAATEWALTPGTTDMEVVQEPAAQRPVSASRKLKSDTRVTGYGNIQDSRSRQTENLSAFGERLSSARGRGRGRDRRRGSHRSESRGRAQRHHAPSRDGDFEWKDEDLEPSSQDTTRPADRNLQAPTMTQQEANEAVRCLEPRSPTTLRF
ncbi:hypothetical protein FGADI_13432 [Fusarium gaditjirri]|uniref:Uncharacterized protein n=1 Tax=Fusarium gaditjirri TaxID=282569 RepID=A0A8H4WMW5_9HYPO|nr:hypothetical protein FGADI_13432 [Fusarium gaditjirri]